MSWKYIHLAAAEIEGGWKKVPGHKLHDDVSVKVADFIDSGYIGEIVGEPLSNETSLMNFIRDNWPTETPKCCGFHIHTSFKDITYYCKLMEQDFYKKFLQEMKRWGEDNYCRNDYFWERLEGKNTFCAKKFYPEKQARCASKEEARQGNLRRTHLNYCYGQYKTLENRMFPTFKDYRKAQSATKYYLDFIERYLDKKMDEHKELGIEIEDEFKLTDNQIQLKPFNYFKKVGSRIVPAQQFIRPETANVKETSEYGFKIDNVAKKAKKPQWSDALGEETF